MDVTLTIDDRSYTRRGPVTTGASRLIVGQDLLEYVSRRTTATSSICSGMDASSAGLQACLSRT